MDISLSEEENSKENIRDGNNVGLTPLKISRDDYEPPNFKSPRSPPPRSVGDSEKVVESVKSVMVGDAQIGKTCLVNSFLFDEFDKNYNSTVRDDYTFCTTVAVGVPICEGNVDQNDVGHRHYAKVDVDVDLDISDTGGQTYLDRLRPLCYGDGITSRTDIAIICFSVVIPSSFTNVTKRWVPEIRRHCLNSNKNMKTILVGTQSDLRSDVNILLNLMEDGLAPITETRATRLAKKIGALKYLECSSLTGANVKRVFDTAIYSKVTIPASVPLFGTHPNNNNLPKMIKSPLESFTQPLSIVSNNAISARGQLQDKHRPHLARQTSSISILNTGDPRLFSWKRCRLRHKSNKIKRLVLSCLR